jgi:L-seryl-tRNA(Ser) seleniumtransferase
MNDARRDLPSIDRLLREPEIQALLESAPRAAVVAAIRETVAAARNSRSGPVEDWAAEVRERLARRTGRSLKPVVNATGVVLHTNLGRAPLAAAAARAVAEVAERYSTLEFDLATGSRGHRADHCRDLLAELSGAEDGLVVNNAAGALVLALNALADGRRVLISRGELIEIGGSFRIPDIMGRSGARLEEVGTTNRTHLADYQQAIAGAGAILAVHRSNFEILGFVATPDPADLAALARAHAIPFLHDVGSGLMLDLERFGLRNEPLVPKSVRNGADLVLFSGDKLLGGPQAGCLVGGRAIIDRCRSNPLARALRADRFTLAAMEATLGLYGDPETALRDIPVLAMLTMAPEMLRARAERLAEALPGAFAPTLIPGESTVGGGSFPGAALPTTLVRLSAGPLGPDGLALRLRLGRDPVVTRVAEGAVLLDPRTIRDDEFRMVAGALAAVLEG